MTNVNRLLVKHKKLSLDIIEFDGIKIHTSPYVLMPFLTNTSKFFQENLQFTDNATCLEIGVGSGYNIIKIAKRNPTLKLYGTDINIHALNIAKENLRINNVTATIFQSDLFENINGKFDYIIFNPPLIFGKPISELEKSVLDNKGQILKNFLSSVSFYMKRNSKIYIIYTNYQYDNFTAKDFFEYEAKKNNFYLKEINALDVGYEIYTIYELTNSY